SRATCAHRTAQVFLNLVSPAALQAAPPRPFGPLPRPSRGRNPSCRGRLHSNLCPIPFGAVIIALRLTAHRSAQVSHAWCVLRPFWPRPLDPSGHSPGQAGGEILPAEGASPGTRGLSDHSPGVGLR